MGTVVPVSERDTVKAATREKPAAGLPNRRAVVRMLEYALQSGGNAGGQGVGAGRVGKIGGRSRVRGIGPSSSPPPALPLPLGRDRRRVGVDVVH